MLQPIPQRRPKPIVGNVSDLDTSAPVQSLMRLGRELGPIYRLKVMERSLVIVSSSALVAELCDEQRFDKRIHGALQHIRDFAGDGLFTARTDEPNWGLAHRILMPAFGPAAMRHYFEPMLDIAEQMLTKWERQGPTVLHDVPDNMTRLTLDTIALCGFGTRLNSFYQTEMHPFVDAMVRALAEAGLRSKRLPVHTRLMLITQQRYARDVAFMNSLVDQVIADRRAHPTSERDLLALMLEAQDPVTGEKLDDLNIRHQIVTFLIAGHETTSGLLSFTLHHLLKHPTAMAKAREEVLGVLGTDARVRPRFEQIAQLTYVDQVLRETLRLWPTAPAFAVSPKEKTVVGGRYEVTPEDEILILTPLLHRDASVWGPDVEVFDPDRFGPEKRAAIPTSAFRPFGNGQRSCIGQQFAMQEATLVIAMLLQRFDLSAPGEYQLKVKETLTLKPEGLSLRVQKRPQPEGPVAAAITLPSVARAVPAVAVPKHGTIFQVFYGSNSGSSETFARRLASDATARGWSATVEPLDHAVGKLSSQGAVVIVTASYNGQPPDNARRFCSWLDSAAPGSLKGVRFSVFGTGHRDWAATYQAVPKRVDAALEAAGAERLLPLGEADARADYFGAFDRWTETSWPALTAAFKLPEVTPESAPRFSVQKVAGPRETLERAHGLARAEVVENRELVDMASPFARSKRHIVLQLPEGMTYETGDHLAVLPENAREQVTRAARRFGLSLDDQVVVHSARGGASFPVDLPVSVGELLGRHLELGAPATRRDLEVLARHTACPPHQAQLLAMRGDGYEQEILEKRVSVLDLLERFAACALPFAELLDLLPTLKPRRYSIASSPKAGERRCVLTVAVVDAPAWSGQGRYRGTASTYLQNVRPGDHVSVAVQHHAFRLPADAKTPAILVAAGTGLAPFRGFIEERAKKLEAGETLGEALLFFGCDHPEVDFLYRDELKTWQQQGAVEVFSAFFRQPDQDVKFVQHRMLAEKERVRSALEDGAAYYVCGDGRNMAPAAREALGKIWAESKGLSSEQTEEWLQSLEKAGRYKSDVFGA